MNAEMQPEQLQALAYIRRRGTEATAASIRERVAKTCSELDALIASIPDAVMQQHRATSGWCIEEVIDHLAETDRPGVEQLRSLLRGEDVGDAIPAHLQSDRRHTSDWRGLAGELSGIHRDFLALLEDAGEETALTATAPVVMVVKCAGDDGVLRPVTWTERFDWKAFAIILHTHIREHMAQIRRILDAPPVES